MNWTHVAGWGGRIGEASARLSAAAGKEDALKVLSEMNTVAIVLGDIAGDLELDSSVLRAFGAASRALIQSTRSHRSAGMAMAQRVATRYKKAETYHLVLAARFQVVKRKVIPESVNLPKRAKKGDAEGMILLSVGSSLNTGKPVYLVPTFYGLTTERSKPKSGSFYEINGRTVTLYEQVLG